MDEKEAEARPFNGNHFLVLHFLFLHAFFLYLSTIVTNTVGLVE